MHPAYSVIVFTIASGAGYGLTILLTAFDLFNLVPISGRLGLAGMAGALALVLTGLFSSTAHLGRPERAWRALSQWRSSWLSRESIAAIATLAPIVLTTMGWVLFNHLSGIFAVCAAVTDVFALLTLWCTGMIYASLATVRAWHLTIVPPIYVVLALATGAVLLHLVLALFGQPTETAAVTAILALTLSAILKLTYWSIIDHDRMPCTVGSAIGIEQFGSVKALETGHTQANYVMREMGYQIGRKHAKKLRCLCLILLIAIPICCLAMSLVLGRPFAAPLGIVATLSAAMGVAIERWLFFAEAQHVVTLYYGAAAV
jgi:DMSO reductase anchor subunit